MNYTGLYAKHMVLGTGSIRLKRGMDGGRPAHEPNCRQRTLLLQTGAGKQAKHSPGSSLNLHQICLDLHLTLRIWPARYMVVLRMGGMYMDGDVECRRPLDELMLPGDTLVATRGWAASVVQTHDLHLTVGMACQVHGGAAHGGHVHGRGRGVQAAAG